MRAPSCSCLTIEVYTQISLCKALIFDQGLRLTCRALDSAVPWPHILEFLDARSTARVGATCKLLAGISNEDATWKSLVLRQFKIKQAAPSAGCSWKQIFMSLNGNSNVVKLLVPQFCMPILPSSPLPATNPSGHCPIHCRGDALLLVVPGRQAPGLDAHRGFCRVVRQSTRDRQSGSSIAKLQPRWGRAEQGGF